MLDALFRQIFDSPPNAWQRAAFEALLAGAPPQYLKVPTAGGKTAILAIFVAALAAQAQAGRVTLARRLVLVVNRRALVDQASTLASTLAEIVACGAVPEITSALSSLSPRHVPLVVSTLRGALADNGEWALDPATPALILGTPDMIGSRLLFRGYGTGRSRAATHAGLLGVDTIVVHDEAHLAPVFSAVLREVEILARPSAVAVGRPPLHVLEMTATLDPRADAGRALECRLTDDPALASRMQAPKRLDLVAVPADGKKVKPAVRVLNVLTERALTYVNACKAVALFVDRPEIAGQLTDRLTKAGVPTDRIVTLTGTMRGWERERVTRSEAFQRFLPTRTSEDVPTAYFICTSAGEIGLDIDADVGLLDLVTLDRFVQRAGRINRRGRNVGELVLVHAQGEEINGALREPSEAALALLDTLEDGRGGRDASPLALTRLTETPQYAAAVPPAPPRRSLESAILTQWAMTTLRLDALRVPPPHVFLHGLDEEDVDVDLVWRAMPRHAAQHPEWFEVWPVLPHERAKLPLVKARGLIEALWARAREQTDERSMFVVLDSQGRLIEGGSFTARAELRAIQRQISPGRTVIICQDLGGLSHDGLPDAESVRPVADVSAESRGDVLVMTCEVHLASGRTAWLYENGRAEALSSLIAAVRPDHELVLAEDLDLPVADLIADHDATVSRRVRVWLLARQVLSPDGGDLASLSRCDRALADHLDLARKSAQAIFRHLDLPPPLAAAVESAAAHHDLGKQDPQWQAALGNPSPAVPLAKSRRPAFDVRLNDGYRHELGSVVMLGEQLGGLERHLIAAHHGWARPGFADRARAKPGCLAAADRVAESFAQLNERFGLWGLAYLEAVVKSADVLAELEADRLGAMPGAPPAAAMPEQGGRLPAKMVEIPADPRNFGEYLACIGLLGLLSHLHHGLSASWTDLGFRLIGADDVDILAAVDRLLAMKVRVDEPALRDELRGDKFPPLRLRLGEAGLELHLNNWLAMDYAGKSDWKLSAGQTEAVGILRGLVSAASGLHPRLVAAEDLFQLGTTMKERFRFDAGTSWSARDAGFTLNENDRFSTVRVFVELLSILGVQYAFVPPGDRDPFHYVAWRRPLPAALCLPAAKGLLSVPGERYVPRRVSSGQMKDVFTSELTLSNEESTWLPKHLIV